MIAGELRNSYLNHAINKRNGAVSDRQKADAWDTVPGEGIFVERKRNAVLMEWVRG